MSEAAPAAVTTTEGTSAPLEAVSDGAKKVDKAPAEVKKDPISEMQRAAHKRFDEATALRKDAEKRYAEAEQIKNEALKSRSEIENFIELTKSDPRALAKIYGPEAAKKIAEDLLFKLYEQEKLSPEELKARAEREAEREELERYRKKEKADKEAQEAAQREKIIEEEGSKLDEQIATAIKDYGLTPTPMVVKRIARYLEAQIESKEELSLARVVPRVHEELFNESVSYLKDMPIEQFMEEYPTIVNKIRAADLKSSAPDVPSFKTGAVVEDKKPKEPTKKKSIEEHFRSL